MARAKREYSITRTGNGIAFPCPPEHMSYMIGLLFGEDDVPVIDNIDYNRKHAELTENARLAREQRERILRNIGAGADPLGDIPRTPAEIAHDNHVDNFLQKSGLKGRFYDPRYVPDHETADIR